MKRSFLLFFCLCFLSLIQAKAGGTYHMTVGQTQMLYFSTSRDIKSTAWYSASASIVQVTSSGGTMANIKAVKSFPSKVIVRCDYYYWITSGSFHYLAKGFEDFDIYVNPINPTKISIQSSLTMDIGDQLILTPTLTPSNAETTLTWSSDNKSVATVSSSGQVRAINQGSANITVKTSNGLSSICKVTVNQLPNAAGTIIGPSAVCKGQNSVIYTVPTIANATSYIWTLPSGATGTSNKNSIVVNFGSSAISGNITVKGTNSSGNGAASIFTVIVSTLPAIAGIITGQPAICQGQNEVTYTVPN